LAWEINWEGKEQTLKKKERETVRQHRLQLQIKYENREMKKKNLVFNMAIITISCLAFSCNKSITEPEKRIKTPREMTWTADTLTSPDPTSIQLMMRNILAFSPNDIWVCGWSDVARGLLWHYDGKSWTESNIAADVGGMRVNDIAGYNSSNLWAVGYSGDEIFIARYDGTHWTRQNNMNIKGELLDMSKDPSGNIWACGRNGVILKYDKTRWIADTIKINFSTPTEYFLKSIEYYNSKAYVLATTLIKNTGILKYYYIYGDINKWTIADSMTFDATLRKIKWGNWGLYGSAFEKIYSFGNVGSWIYDNENWQPFNNSSATIHGMNGISENYLFAVGDFKQILFYDGNNWENLIDIFHVKDSNFVFSNVWTTGYETFIIGDGNVGRYDGTIIFHGK